MMVAEIEQVLPAPGIDTGHHDALDADLPAVGQHGVPIGLEAGIVQVTVSIDQIHPDIVTVCA